MRDSSPHRLAHAIAFLAVLSLGLAGCELFPAPPQIERDVAMVLDGEFTYPHIPPHRTSADGRVAVVVQGGAPEVDFYLFVPEKLETTVMHEAPGPKILASRDPVRFVFPPPDIVYPDNGRDYGPSAVRVTGHHSICDATTEFPSPDEQTNPYPCGPELAHDCYDITLINTTAHPGGAQLWGTPIHVEVENPKTAAAQLAVVEMGAPVAGLFLEMSPEWTEPMITRDGRLLTGRFGVVMREWIHPETGESFREFYDIMYALLPDDAEPCDVTGWQDLHPISHAPYDPRMIGRYGIAAYPFRDVEGNPVPDGEDIGGTYPWVDRDGANLFMSGVTGRLTDSETRHPSRCVTPGCDDPAFAEPGGWQKGFMVAGLWTHGKAVMLDGLVNHQDWALPVDPDGHRLVTLYQRQADAIEVRAGAGRAIGRQGIPAGFAKNPNILDSIQNVFNHQSEFVPVTPHEVVWVMSTGVATDEVSFDDSLDPDGFIVSNMQASVTREMQFTGIPPNFFNLVKYWNGLRYIPVPPDFTDEVHLQNGATPPTYRWQVPAYGLVPVGMGRVEPVAMGGIRGKGFWLKGWNSIHYAVPEQPRDIRDHEWEIGIFFDARDREAGERTLLHFPDGSELRLAGRDQVLYRAAGETLHRVTLPVPFGEGWTHLALNLKDQNRDVVLFHDGFAFDRFQSPVSLFEMTPGDLFVGDVPDDDVLGMRGWVDEFEVFARSGTLEMTCNQIYGTLVGIEDNEAWDERAALYPTWAHDMVGAAHAAAGQERVERYACYHDHTGDNLAHVRNLPAGTFGVRDAIHFPEGPVRFGSPRPDSTGNAFCRTCHHAQGQGGLGIDALAYNGGVNAEHDPRRQPTQALRRVFGNIPAGWIEPGPGPGGPPVHTRAPSEGLLTDPWVLPSP